LDGAVLAVLPLNRRQSITHLGMKLPNETLCCCWRKSVHHKKSANRPQPGEIEQREPHRVPGLNILCASGVDYQG
jgi:hypothetical protein